MSYLHLDQNLFEKELTLPILDFVWLEQTQTHPSEQGRLGTEGTLQRLRFHFHGPFKNCTAPFILHIRIAGLEQLQSLWTSSRDCMH